MTKRKADETGIAEPVSEEEGVAAPVSVKEEVVAPAVGAAAAAAPVAVAKAKGGGPKITPETLRVFYDRLFPSSKFFRWLSYGDAKLIKKREFSFTLDNDIYIRYCSFANRDEFKKGLLSKLPYKIDIGAIFNAPPDLHQSVQNFAPEEKELVFDIDMTDYDDVRICCDGASICHKCWPLMSAAIKVVDEALRVDFGFKHLLWVYSGRRGVHCWVSDKRARVLSNEGRSAVVEYLSIYMGSENNKKISGLTHPLSPSLARAYAQLKPYFESVSLEHQGMFDSEKSCRAVLDLVDAEHRDSLTWRDMDADPRDKWKELQKRVEKFNRVNKKFNASVKTLLPQLVFSNVFPRLDINVSKQMNHLLKSPFCVHPKTGRVCVLIDAANCDDFDPFETPTLMQLNEELNRPGNGGGDKEKAWERTSLKPHIELFTRFVERLEQDYAPEAKARAAKVKREGGLMEDDQTW